jgi:hypothetical protein
MHDQASHLEANNKLIHSFQIRIANINRKELACIGLANNP